MSIFVFGLNCILYGYTHFLLVAICLEYHPPPLHFESMFICKAEVSLLEAAYCWVLVFSSIRLLCVFWLVNEVHLHLRCIVDEWELSTAILSLVFWLLCVSCLFLGWLKNSLFVIDFWQFYYTMSWRRPFCTEIIKCSLSFMDS